MINATERALELFRKICPEDSDEKILVLGSIHNLKFKFDTNIDWFTRAFPNKNVNFRLNEINSGYWNVVINCCCEHMVPMSQITLKGVYVLQSNDRYCDTHINRMRSMQQFREQCDLSDIFLEDEVSIDDVTYYTIIGEKW